MAVGSKSVGSYALRARGWGRAAAGDQTRGGAAPVSLELSKVGRPGLVWLSFFAEKHKSGMRNPLGWIAGCCGAGRGGLADMGGSAAVEQRQRACSCREGGLRAKPSNATERGGGDVAHRGSNRAWGVVQGVRRRRPAARRQSAELLHGAAGPRSETGARRSS